MMNQITISNTPLIRKAFGGHITKSLFELFGWSTHDVRDEKNAAGRKVVIIMIKLS
jgi:hypothetical protein